MALATLMYLITATPAQLKFGLLFTHTHSSHWAVQWATTFAAIKTLSRYIGVSAFCRLVVSLSRCLILEVVTFSSQSKHYKQKLDRYTNTVGVALA